MDDVASGASGNLQFRIWNEFQEMPGLRLTVEQATRLWGTEPSEMRTILEAMVDAAVLQRIGPYYFRADLARFSG